MAGIVFLLISCVGFTCAACLLASVVLGLVSIPATSSGDSAVFCLFFSFFKFFCSFFQLHWDFSNVLRVLVNNFYYSSPTDSSLFSEGNMGKTLLCKFPQHCFLPCPSTRKASYRFSSVFSVSAWYSLWRKVWPCNPIYVCHFQGFHTSIFAHTDF